MSSAGLGLAIALAVLGACCYALGARMQNKAIVTEGGCLRVVQLLRLLSHRRWLAGLLLLGAGTGFHVWPWRLRR